MVALPRRESGSNLDPAGTWPSAFFTPGYGDHIAWGRVVAEPAFHHIAEQLIQYLDIKPGMPGSRSFLAMQGGVP